MMSAIIIHLVIISNYLSEVTLSLSLANIFYSLCAHFLSCLLQLVKQSAIAKFKITLAPKFFEKTQQGPLERALIIPVTKSSQPERYV